MRTLVLDQGYQPRHVIPWQKAVSMLYVGKADVVEEYGEVIRSPRVELKMPAVVRLRRRSPWRPPKVRFCRVNVMLRDEMTCQYCGEERPIGQLTYDHVVPRCQGGETSWENIVTACRPCNEAKGGRTPKQAGMPLLRVPKRPWTLPSVAPGAEVRRVPEAWRVWLGRAA